MAIFVEGRDPEARKTMRMRRVLDGDQAVFATALEVKSLPIKAYVVRVSKGVASGDLWKKNVFAKVCGRWLTTSLLPPGAVMSSLTLNAHPHRLVEKQA